MCPSRATARSTNKLKSSARCPGVATARLAARVPRTRRFRSNSTNLSPSGSWASAACVSARALRYASSVMSAHSCCFRSWTSRVFRRWRCRSISPLVRRTWINAGRPRRPVVRRSVGSVASVMGPRPVAILGPRPDGTLRRTLGGRSPRRWCRRAATRWPPAPTGVGGSVGNAAAVIGRKAPTARVGPEPG